ncbi:NAD-P-binding protein [Mycena venus]|uniref:NAD-P-binding protein n=1 Tax=Mycena venus TaxID=2733690 RepID=A0A8H7CQ28_9AGAR|nr:NAD-P-binding protein [Mycena venus]
MSQVKTNFFLTGATGYIGGTVLTRFLAHPRANTFRFTVLVRDPKKAEVFKELGVKAVVGSRSDVELVERLASQADVVISIADCDDVGAAKATLQGLRKRGASGTVPIFIHTSGAGVIFDDAKGMHSDATIYDDSDADQIETIAPTQKHRDVDLLIIAADTEGMYSIRLGTGHGTPCRLGRPEPSLNADPILVKAALDRGRAGMVGEEKNIWHNVEIHELADLYITLYDKIVADPDTGHGRNGFYFGESGEHSLYAVSKEIGTALVALKKSDSAEPMTFTQADLNKYFRGSSFLGSNSRCRATRARAFGWKPTKSTSDMLASIRPEMEVVIKKNTGSAT